MTTIVAHAGKLAADRRQVGPHLALVTKLFAFKGSIFATAGDSAWGEVFTEWLRDGQPRDRRDAIFKQMTDCDASFLALQIRPDGKIVLWASPWLPLEIEQDAFGVGSGSAYALGALSAGASIEDAIRIASRWDECTGPDVQVLTLADAKRRRKR